MMPLEVRLGALPSAVPGAADAPPTRLEPPMPPMPMSLNGSKVSMLR